MSSCVSPAASRRWRASRRWWAVRLGGLPKRTPLAFARVYTTKPLVRAPSGYATATLAPSKGRLTRCTVDGLTPNRSAMTRMPGRPGVARASRIRFSSARRRRLRSPSSCFWRPWIEGRSALQFERLEAVADPYFAAAGNAGNLSRSRASCWMMTVALEPATIFLTRSSDASVCERSVLKAGTPLVS